MLSEGKILVVLYKMAMWWRMTRLSGARLEGNWRRYNRRAG